MAMLQAKQDALTTRIAGLDLCRDGWSAPARADALTRLSAMGLPGKRDEYWRYTDPVSLTSHDPLPAALGRAGSTLANSYRR